MKPAGYCTNPEAEAAPRCGQENEHPDAMIADAAAAPY